METVKFENTENVINKYLKKKKRKKKKTAIGI